MFKKIRLAYHRSRMSVLGINLLRLKRQTGDNT